MECHLLVKEDIVGPFPHHFLQFSRSIMSMLKFIILREWICHSWETLGGSNSLCFYQLLFFIKKHNISIYISILIILWFIVYYSWNAVLLFFSISFCTHFCSLFFLTYVQKALSWGIYSAFVWDYFETGCKQLLLKEVDRVWMEPYANCLVFLH